MFLLKKTERTGESDLNRAQFSYDRMTETEFLLFCFVCLFYQERMMPGVIMATECKAFDKLYQLTDLEEPTITVRVQRLLMLLPTDPDVQEALESISQQVTKL